MIMIDNIVVITFIPVIIVAYDASILLWYAADTPEVLLCVL